jgi:hypothetical protein
MSPAIRNQAKLAGVALAAGFALTAFGAGDAWAANTQFNKGPFNDGVERDGTDDVSGKITGLGNEDVRIVADASAAVLEVCINRGGNHPEAANKESTIADVEASATFPSPKNGNLNFTLTLEPPDTGLTCPGNQVLRVACAEYADKTVTVEQPPFTVVIGPTETDPSSASAIFLAEFTQECDELFAMNP